MTPTIRIFLDGNRVTPGTKECRCTEHCEWPCWQRLGLTTEPCCPQCPPLPEPERDP